MITRALDGDGDWTFGQGKGNYLTRADAIGQNCACRINSFLGDCYFALRDGIDWFNLFGSRGKKVAIELAVSGKLLQADGVTGVTKVSATVNSNRKISLSYSVDTVYTGLTNEGITQAANYLLTQDGVVITTEDGSRITV